MKFPFLIWYFLAGAVWVGALLPVNFLWFWLVLIFVGIFIWLWIDSARSLLAKQSWFFGIASFCLLIFLLSSLNAGWRIYEPKPISSSSSFAGPALIVKDPVPYGAGISFRVKIEYEERQLIAEVFAYSGNSFKLEDWLTGEWVYLEGRLTPPKNTSFGIAARLSVKEVGEHSMGSYHFQIANGIRRTLAKGADSLGENQKALFTGIIYGDDRNQSIAQRDLFRSTGLTHILAVSGQNVAFVLAVFFPLTRKLTNSFKWIVLLGVLGIFITITRFEPSVLRATTMALSAILITQARSKKSNPKNFPRFFKPSGLKLIVRSSIQPKAVLGIAVLSLILISPQIVGRLAFQLSVMASAGIIFLSQPIANRLKGPNWFRLPLSITLSAQLAVAPLLTKTFGGVAVGALPANILALPAVGIATVWGMTAGVAAGLFGETAGRIIHLPTRLLLGWVEGVASWSDSLGLGWLGHWHIWILFLCLGFSFLVRKKQVRIALGVMSIAILFLPAISQRLDDSGIKELGEQTGSFYWRDKNLLVIDNQLTAGRLLDSLRLERISNIDLVVFTRHPRLGVLDSLEERFEIKNLWTPTGKYYPGSEIPKVGSTHLFNDLVLRVLSVDKQIQFQACAIHEVNHQTEIKLEIADEIPWKCGVVFGQEVV